MSSVKMIFNQTIMISTFILLGLGIQTAVEYFSNNIALITWPWYMPLSIILTGFLCSLPSLLVLNIDNMKRWRIKLRIFLHFLLTFEVVTFSGWLFGWYSNTDEYIPIAVMFIMIYCFVWGASTWLDKMDEKKINEEIKKIQDKE